MNFFTRQASDRLRTPTGKSDWQRLWRDYEIHLARLRRELTPGWQALADADFHDARITLVKQLSKSETVLGTTRGVLTFRGVSKVWLLDSVVATVWLYHEVDHTGTPGQFCLRVLLSDDEIMVTAEDVEVAVTAEGV